jgi:hypothetical protein
VFVAVGVSGQVLTSLDGTTWTKGNTGTYSRLLSVAYGKGLFVATGEDGVILTSPDGTTWTKENSGTGEWLHSVAFGDSLFVVVGENGKIFRSSNAKTWTGLTICNNSLDHVSSCGNMFVSTGNDGILLVSRDAVNWEISFIDSMSWIGDIIYNDSLFVSVGCCGRIITSADAVTWTAARKESSGYCGLYSVTFGNGTYVAVGIYGTIVTSTDGIEWKDISSGLLSGLNSIAFGGGMFVSTGYDGVVATSNDGIKWSGGFPGKYHGDINAIVYGNDRFVAVGDSGRILSSEDGIKWTEMFPDTVSDLMSVAYGDGLFVAAGNAGVVLTSPDGLKWNRIDLGVKNDYNSIAFGNGTFVASGYRNDILVRLGSSMWIISKVSEDSIAGYSTVAFCNNRFFFSGDFHSTYVSQNGLSWAEADPDFPEMVRSPAGGNGRFAALGPGCILSSSDGVNWVENPLIAESYLESIAYGNNRFVAVGEGIIISSEADESQSIRYTLAGNAGYDKTRINNYKDRLTISYENFTKYMQIETQIYNSLGKEVYSSVFFRPGHILEIPTSGLSPGMYLCRIAEKGKKISGFKVFITH